MPDPVPELQERLVALLAEQTGLDPADLTPDRTFRSLEIDSLGLVELIVSVENDTGIELPADIDGIDRDTTLGQTGRILDRYAQAAGDPAR
jgi:acyl carrier protein